MDFFGFPIWVVALICFGVFCASFMDAIGGGGGIISLPSYLLAGIPVHFALGTNKLSSCIGTVASTVRYIKNETNLGASGSRNLGVQMAKGKYVAFRNEVSYRC